MIFLFHHGITLSWTNFAFKCHSFFGLCATQRKVKGLDFGELQVRLTFSPPFPRLICIVAHPVLSLLQNRFSSAAILQFFCNLKKSRTSGWYLLCYHKDSTSFYQMLQISLTAPYLLHLTHSRLLWKTG